MGKVFKVIELVGISPESYEDAIKRAVEQASETLHGLSWFEVTEKRGRIVEGKVVEFQAVMKVGFKLD